ncbi:hypothetical protein F8E02_06455 [Methanoculleus sp. Wushi-C6]|uniref:Uncharacterized protein n=1 Tax=Methanoculleus caldifontis TaxID=2651577 RepID=A0ABU3X0S9_9EURY|nr:hypothetical protein [Methanoculleus sp. Wushi-C6]MDV2481650.1 hypothetical protein [Methanoculleus sp. Wushi-C6]
MSGKREVTIGITINLQNYENLRLEVEGDVETQEDVDELITFLDGVLARLGRGDPATAERVDAYRRRVLKARSADQERPAEEPVEAEAETPAPAAPPVREEEPAAPPVRAEEPAAPALREEEPAHPEEKRACPSVELIAAAIPPAPEQPPTPEPAAKPEEPAAEEAPPHQEPAAAQPPAASAGEVCEICGAAVTKSQAKLSQLFMSKTLCKKCMEQP